MSGFAKTTNDLRSHMKAKRNPTLAMNPSRGPIAARNVGIARFNLLVRKEKIQKRSKSPFKIKNSARKYVNGYPLNKDRKNMDRGK
jgi:hypothetical protein